MHGGLFSKDDVTIEDIRKVDRNRQPPDSGIIHFFIAVYQSNFLKNFNFKNYCNLTQTL